MFDYDDDSFDSYSYSSYRTTFNSKSSAAAVINPYTQGVSSKLKPFVSQIVGYLATTPELVTEKVDEIQPQAYESRFRTLVVENKIPATTAIDRLVSEILRPETEFRDFLLIAADPDHSCVDPSIRWSDAFVSFIDFFGFFVLKCVDESEYHVLEEAFKDLLLPLRNEIVSGKVY